MTGVRVGKYELVELLGRGGMGEVWKARDAELGRIVALKLLQGSEPEDLKRFEREAQTVAQLNHPHIAQVYEFSPNPPHLAMQFIEGTSIDAAKDRFAALRDAARAVHFAHQHGVLHRDIKPANIMVDAAGRAFVLDFGLARDVKGDKTAMTLSGDILGTPSYMAPEQARGDVHALDVRTDVYGLGATLYVLLAGRPPHTGPTVYDVIYHVVNDDPTPSGGDVDLQTICMKALAREPDRRYATAEAFADDLDRFIRKEPIRARPASILYRIGKRIQRQPVLWSLAAVLALASAFGVWQLARVAKERGDKLTAVDAQRRAERISAAVDRSTQLLSEAEEATYAPDVSFETLKPKGQALLLIVGASLADFPNNATLWYFKGKAHALLGEDDEALRAFTRAIELDPDDGRSRFERAMIHLNRFQEELIVTPLSDFAAEGSSAVESILPKVRTDLRLAQSTLGEDQKLAADLWELYAQLKNDLVHEGATARIKRGGRTEHFYHIRAMALINLRRYDEALSDFTEALDRHPGLGRAWFNRGSLNLYQRRPAEALSDSQRALRLSPALAVAHSNAGNALRELGRYDEAIEAHSRAIELRQDAANYVNRGNAYKAKKDYARAIQDYDRALSLKADLAGGYFNRGTAYHDLMQFDKALADFEKALDLHKDMKSAHAYLAVCHLHMGRSDLALQECERALAFDPRDARTWYTRGQIHHQQDRLEEAVADYSRALAVDDKLLSVLSNRAKAYDDLGQYERAIKDYERSLSLAPPDWPQRPLIQGFLDVARRRLKAASDF